MRTAAMTFSGLGFFVTAGLALLGGCSSTRTATPQPIAQASDIDGLVGGTWVGSLTYLDYTSKKPYTMPSTLTVERVAGSASSWTFRLGYPDEPHANREELVVLSEQGRVFDGEAVVERATLPGGGVRVVTETDGEDDRRPARIRHLYLVGRSSFSIQKLVRFSGEAEFIERNTYRWAR